MARKMGRPAAATHAADGPERDRLPGAIDTIDSKRTNREQVGTVIKGARSEIRVSLKSWRGQKVLEIREFVSPIPGFWNATTFVITLNVDKTGELVTAIQAVALLDGKAA